MSERRRFLAQLAVVLLSSGCRSKTTGTLERAEFGVFFGGQVQERERIPLVVGKQQEHGIRLVFREPLARDVSVRWEVNMPSRSRPKQLSARITVLGEATVRAGAERFERVLEFGPDDVPGTWNIRVLVGDELAIDRAFLVYDPSRPPPEP